MNIAFIFPVFNPEDSSWAEKIIQKSKELKALLYEFNLLFFVVNDGSKFNFNEYDKNLLKENGFCIESYTENRGKGFALKKGLEIANADIYIFTDLDMPYSYGTINEMIQKLISNENTLIIVPQRDKTYYKKIPKSRKNISLIFKWLIKHLIHLPINDTQAGLKALKAKAVPLALLVKQNRYLFDVELLVKVNKAYRNSIDTVIAQPNENLKVHKMKNKVLFIELINFIKLLITK